jgi:DNA-binding GntR family transcriptional regulator
VSSNISESVTLLPSPVRPAPLSSQVFRILRDAIFTGKIQPGQALREQQLAKALGVSQSTVREALAQLEHIGLAIRRSNQGTTVTQLNAEELRERLRVRLVLEELAATEACRWLTDDDIGRLQAIAEAIAAAMASGTGFEIVAADMEFHRLIWRISRMPILYRILDQLTTPLFAFTGVLYRIGIISSPNALPHSDIVTALRSRDPEVVRKAIRNHVERPYGAIMSSEDQDFDQRLAAFWQRQTEPVDAMSKPLVRPVRLEEV